MSLGRPAGASRPLANASRIMAAHHAAVAATDPMTGTALPDRFGFRSGDRGTHGSRSMMLTDLQALLAATPADTSYDGYRIAIMDENVLGKPTASTRLWAWKKLRELYSLDRRVPIFRCLRTLWDRDTTGRPILALLCASARDPLLRLSSPVITAAPIGTAVTSQELASAIQATVPDRFSPTNLKAMGSRLLATWTQAGHLSEGRVRRRTRPVVSPEDVAYALLLGRLAGARGPLLFSTFWCSLLGAAQEDLFSLAAAAARVGWLDLRRAGSVAEVGFTHLLAREELEALRESD